MKKEELKKETLEEAKQEIHTCRYCGCKWQQERMYNEEEVLTHLNNLIKMPSSELDKFTNDTGLVTMKWFEQFKTNQSTK